MTDLSLLTVFLAGMISFLSPCVLPLVPPYLTYLAGTTLDRLTDDVDAAMRRRAVITAIIFVAGFSTVFVLLGATASVLGNVLRQYSHILSIVAGVAIIAMGLHFLGLFRIALLYREARVQVQKPIGMVGAYVMGLAFAFGWTPCIGPVLAAVLSVAGSSQSVTRGMGLLGVYSLGLGVPFVLAAFAMGPFVRLLKRLRAHFGIIEKVMGVLLVLTGIAFLTGGITTVSFWLLEMFPALGRLG